MISLLKKKFTFHRFETKDVDFAHIHKRKIYTDTSQIISEFPFPTDENYEFPTIHLFN
jgi:hypothetical protein